ncbi:hypothetical protein OC842_001946 [Tilletia horrida]|uniref:Carboxylic ester hydrolase n=1 Tax=Tilletia horrida TaxID=155126 RepID=A0AAN6GE51_9BASI|nr:hypothetical protein OC842_001946 [Tilletia horrida]
MLRGLICLLLLASAHSACVLQARPREEPVSVVLTVQNGLQVMLGPSVELAQGQLVGSAQAVDGQALDAFLGVRYAQPPVGPLRFAKPQPVAASNEMINATQFGPACFQNIPNGNFSEDCLFLNLYRPSDPADREKLPVMLFVHGGSFQFGTGNQANGSRIVAESVRAGAPVIWISINYRLGLFGFLGGSSVLAAAQSGSAALNPGMYDVRLALEWVKANIEAFGGDPYRVTLMGQSAGAFITGNQLLANGGDTKGLFQSAIMQSGSPGSASTLPPNHPQLDQTFANISALVNCPVAPIDLSCLKAVDATTLSAAANNITSSFYSSWHTGLLPYMPVQDTLVDGFFFSAPAHELVAQGRFSTVPIISGCNHDEGTGGAPHDLANATVFEQWLQAVAIADTSDQARTSRVVNSIFTLYPDDVTLGAPYPSQANPVSAGLSNISDPFYPPSTNNFKRAAAFYGDWRYVAPHRQFLIKRSNKAQNGVWSYLFAQHDLNVAASRGVSHAAEMPYVFGNTSDSSSPGLYLPLSKQMQRAFISFANFHDPSKLDNLVWPQFDSEQRTTMQFKGMDTRAISRYFNEDRLSYLKSDEAAAVLSS